MPHLHHSEKLAQSIDRLFVRCLSDWLFLALYFPNIVAIPAIKVTLMVEFENDGVESGIQLF